MNIRKNPCWDDATRTSCPNRHGGCAVDCEAWAEYVRERDGDYAREFIENGYKYDVDSVKKDTIHRIRKAKFKSHRSRKRR